MMKKTDNRTKVTKRLLQDSLIKLLKDEKIKDITVKELCIEAEVNRSTFYSHYLDIYDVLENIEKEMYNDLINALVSNEVIGSNNVYYEVFSFFFKHADMCKILLSKNTNSDFIHKALELGRKRFIDLYSVYNNNISMNILDYFYSYVSNGVIGLLRLWFKNDMKESVSEMAKTTEHLVITGINFIK